MPMPRLVTTLIVVSALAHACAETTAQVVPITPDALLASPPAGALILDVRTADEYAAGHVPGAVNVPYDQVAARLTELGDDPTRPVVVYCESGRRAGRAESVILEAGFTDVRHLEGDMQAWRASGRVTE